MSEYALIYLIFFFFKQKTAYEMVGSDWSSDVCSSDLPGARHVKGINRRDLFVGAGSVWGAFLARRARAVASASVRIPPAPVARVDIVKDTYFGETLSDPYRWMENDKDREWLPFLKGQNEHTRAVLD